MSRDLENKEFNNAIELLEKNCEISDTLRAYLNKKETWQLRNALSKLHDANCTLPQNLYNYICNHEKNTLFASSYGILLVPSALIFAKGAHLMAASAGLFVTGATLSATSASLLLTKKVDENGRADHTADSRFVHNKYK